MIRKIVLIVLDSAGVGALPDAEKYNDSGANTIGHIFESWAKIILCRIWKNSDYIKLSAKAVL